MLYWEALFLFPNFTATPNPSDVSSTSPSFWYSFLPPYWYVFLYPFTITSTESISSEIALSACSLLKIPWLLFVIHSRPVFSYADFHLCAILYSDLFVVDTTAYSWFLFNAASVIFNIFLPLLLFSYLYAHLSVYVAIWFSLSTVYDNPLLYHVLYPVELFCQISAKSLFTVSLSLVFVEPSAMLPFVGTSSALEDSSSLFA